MRRKLFLWGVTEDGGWPGSFLVPLGGPGGGSRTEGFPWLHEQQRLQMKEKQEKVLQGDTRGPQTYWGADQG